MRSTAANGLGTVLLVSQPSDGGTAICVQNLAKAGRAAGFTIRLAGEPEGELHRWAVDHGFDWRSLSFTRGVSLGDLSSVWQLRRLAKDVDVLHLNSSKAGATGRLAQLGRSVKPAVVFTPHGWSWLVGGRAARAYRGIERRLARRTDVIVAVSAGEADAGRSVLGDNAPVRVIRNGVDTEVFTPDGDVAPRDAAPLLVCVGRLARQKGQDVLLHAMKLLDPSVRLRLLGDGPDETELRHLAAELGIADRVEFAGTGDPRPHYRAADVVVLPSRWEGFSLVLLEAMSCGGAVVAGATAGSEAVADSVVTVPPGDAEALAASCQRLLDDAGERTRLSRAAREQVECEFALDTSMQQTLGLWSDLISAGRDR
jgi:glycosyltransferase involved in cell wall biosynthesis